MINEPLGERWRYALGHRKIFEFRSSLGLEGDGPAPSSAVWAYGVVPGLARVLTHREIAGRRDDLRLVRVEAAFASELDMRGELVCAIDISADDEVSSVISCVDDRGALAVVSLHLAPSTSPVPMPPLGVPTGSEELRVDAGPCVAFAAATWDLNPAYWDRDLAQLAGLGGPIAPPGLPVALAVEAIERAAGRHLSSYDVHFDRAARPGDVLDLRVAAGADEARFELVSEAGPVLHGTAVLGHSRDGL